MATNFITNSPGSKNLKTRLETLTGISEELKFLVGFFYFSGWRELYQKLKENPDVKLKILVGLETERLINGIVEVANPDTRRSNQDYLTDFIKSLKTALNNDQMDHQVFYEQVNFFKQMLEENRLVIRKTLQPNHAKLYLFKFQETQKNIAGTEGVIITGSSNFTQAGLHRQKEFNVEIRDYGFEEAETYFDDLWLSAVPISEAPNGKKFIIDVLENGAITSEVTPYEAYAFALKTYIDLVEARQVGPSLDRILEKAGFDKYAYQVDAVNQALNIIDNYQGVIIADVVGLGKSVIASLIAKQLKKRGLILAPPSLIGNKHDKTGWHEYTHKFELYDWDIDSTGSLDKVAERIRTHNENYEVVIIDEAHRFRNEDTANYEALFEITRDKTVILLTATPFNNSPTDIFALLKLFIIPGFSGLTLNPDLQADFQRYNSLFKRLSYILKNYNSDEADKVLKSQNYYEQILGQKPPVNIKLVKAKVKELSHQIRRVIEPVIIRRNRLDLKKDFQYKKEIKNLSEIRDPEEIFYQLSTLQSKFYDRILTEYFSKKGRFKGAIYKPFEYENKSGMTGDNQSQNRIHLQQTNLYDFMRRLLVKRFESSFGAFDQSIKRFLKVHKMVKTFIETSGKYILDRQAIENIYDDDNGDFTLEAIEKVLRDFKENAKNKKTPKHTIIYEVDDFEQKEKFLKDIDNDIELFEDILEEINALKLVNNDPKRIAVLEKVNEILQSGETPKRKVVIFTEYADTLKHLKPFFEKKLGRVLFSDGNLNKNFFKVLNENFNAKHPNKKDDYDVLIATDKLSEGVNLNRAGAIINYDIPWNPTRVIQRVGRINRIGIKVFDELYLYNIFPTEKGAKEVKIKEIARQKMFLIHNTLGEDAKIFDVDEEPTPSGLYKKLTTYPENEEDLSLITLVRNNYHKIARQHPEVIEKIKTLPRLIKTAKHFKEDEVIMFRKKGIAMFTLTGKKVNGKTDITEKSFDEILPKIKAKFEDKRLPFGKDFWDIYSEMKHFKPHKKAAPLSGQSIESQALNSLKSLQKRKMNLTADELHKINELIKIIKVYKALPVSTMRRLVLPSNPKEKDYTLLLRNISHINKQLGNNYLQKLEERIKHLKDEVIISFENRKI